MVLTSTGTALTQKFFFFGVTCVTNNYYSAGEFAGVLLTSPF
jgi:hypothetical protein